MNMYLNDKIPFQSRPQVSSGTSNQYTTDKINADSSWSGNTSFSDSEEETDQTSSSLSYNEKSLTSQLKVASNQRNNSLSNNKPINSASLYIEAIFLEEASVSNEDHTEALNLLIKSEKLGNKNAAYRLGELYFYGDERKNLNIDLNLALMYLKPLAKEGNKKAFELIQKIKHENAQQRTDIKQKEAEEAIALGKRYLTGDSKQAKSESQAYYQFEIAAKLGNTEAQYLTAKLGLHSLIKEKSRINTSEFNKIAPPLLDYLKQAADKGYIPAKFQLAMFSAEGKLHPLLPKDILGGFAIFEEIAKTEQCDEQFQLGELYLEHNQNEKAELFFKKAADNGHAKAAFWYAKQVILKKLIDSKPAIKTFDYDEDYSVNNDAKSIKSSSVLPSTSNNLALSTQYQEYLYIAGAGGVKEAWYDLAIMIINDEEIFPQYDDINPKLKLDGIKKELLIDNYLRKAAQLGHAGAEIFLGMNYATLPCSYAMQAPFLTPDEHAHHHFDEAIKKGYNVTKEQLVSAYTQSKNEYLISTNDTKKVQQLRNASAAGIPDATYQLGLIYLKGTHGVQKDEIKAEKCFLKAIKNGYDKGCPELVEKYRKLADKYHNRSVHNSPLYKTHNEDKALEYYKKVYLLSPNKQQFGFSNPLSNMNLIYESRYNSLLFSDKEAKHEAIKIYERIIKDNPKSEQWANEKIEKLRSK